MIYRRRRRKGTEGVAFFNERFIEELKFKCDIVSIVSQYVQLVRKGTRYACVCPFHPDKNPSMYINAQGQFYHCFGCGASGDVITFIMEMESLSYPEAVKFLAERAGMELPEYKADPDYKKKKDKQETLKALMKDAARYYHANLMKEEEGREAREYLASRGINQEISTRFGLGLSLGYDQMQGYLRRKNYTAEELRECGLVTGERLSDAFAGRVIVPIMNGMGDVIAFGGRIYRGEQDVAKYKNSTNTVLFDKSRCVYGINFVKKEKRRGNPFKFLILVEGYMDVISLATAGFFNAVAGMGTALTPQQAREIKKLTDTVYVCYDGDDAGRKAAVRNVEPLLAEGLDVRVVTLADGLDPDDTVKKEGADGFRKRLEAALPVIEYKLKLCEDAYGLGSANAKAKYVKAALRVMAEISDEAEREVYLNIIAEKSGVSVATLRKTLASGGAAPAPGRVIPAEKKSKDGNAVKAARFVLNRIIAGAEYVSVADVSPEWMPLPEQAEVMRYIAGHAESKTLGGDLFSAGLGSEEVGRILDAEMSFSSPDRERRYYLDCVELLADEHRENEIKALREKMKEEPDREGQLAILRQIERLRKAPRGKN